MAIQVFQSQLGEGDSLDSNNDSEEHIDKVLILTLQQHTSQTASINPSSRLLTCVLDGATLISGHDSTNQIAENSKDAVSEQPINKTNQPTTPCPRTRSAPRPRLKIIALSAMTTLDSD